MRTRPSMTTAGAAGAQLPGGCTGGETVTAAVVDMALFPHRAPGAMPRAALLHPFGALPPAGSAPKGRHTRARGNAPGVAHQGQAAPARVGRGALGPGG